MKAYKIKIEKEEFDVEDLPTNRIKLLTSEKSPVEYVVASNDKVEDQDTNGYVEEEYELIEAIDPESKLPLTFMVKTADVEFYKQLTKGVEYIVTKRAEQKMKGLEMEEHGWITVGNEHVYIPIGMTQPHLKLIDKNTNVFKRYKGDVETLIKKFKDLWQRITSK